MSIATRACLMVVHKESGLSGFTDRVIVAPPAHGWALTLVSGFIAWIYTSGSGAPVQLTR